jgi:hypothetical protein
MNPELTDEIVDGHIQGIRNPLDGRQRTVTLSRLDLDAGPDYAYYNADISTSFPPNDRFTPESTSKIDSACYDPVPRQTQI